MDLFFPSLADDDVEEGESVEEETEDDTEVMETSLHGSPDPLPEVSRVDCWGRPGQVGTDTTYRSLDRQLTNSNTCHAKKPQMH